MSLPNFELKAKLIRAKPERLFIRHICGESTNSWCTLCQCLWSGGLASKGLSWADSTGDGWIQSEPQCSNDDWRTNLRVDSREDWLWAWRWAIRVCKLRLLLNKEKSRRQIWRVRRHQAAPCTYHCSRVPWTMAWLGLTFISFAHISNKSQQKRSMERRKQVTRRFTKMAWSSFLKQHYTTLIYYWREFPVIFGLRPSHRNAYLMGSASLPFTALTFNTTGGLSHLG